MTTYPVEFPTRTYGSPFSVDTLVHTTLGYEEGGELPAGVTIEGVEAQLDVLEQWEDASPKSVKVLAVIPRDVTSSEWIEEAGGTESLGSGSFVGTAFTQLTWTLETVTRGSFSGSVGSATSSKVVVGPTNALGHQGGDYYRVSRYEIPLVSTDGLPAPHSVCGRIICYIHNRIDIDGFKVEWMFVNSSIADGDTDGSSEENPGFICYQGLQHPKLVSAPYRRVDLDEWQGDGGKSLGYAVRRFKTPAMSHVSSPGSAPAWVSVFYSTEASTERQARSWLADEGFAVVDTGLDHLSSENSLPPSSPDNMKGRQDAGKTGDGGYREGTWTMQGEYAPFVGPLLTKWLYLYNMYESRRLHYTFLVTDQAAPVVFITAGQIGPQFNFIRPNPTGDSLVGAYDEGDLTHPLGARVFNYTNEGGGQALSANNGTKAWQNFQDGWRGVSKEDSTREPSPLPELRVQSMNDAWVFGMSGIGLELSSAFTSVGIYVAPLPPVLTPEEIYYANR